MFALFASMTLARCDCEEIQEFFPAAAYSPDVLNFGDVAVNTEKSLDIRVTSNGSAGLIISQYSFPGAPAASLGKFKFEKQACLPDATCTALKPEFTTGISPGKTSSITVTYRPCPDAWTGDQLKPDFDFNTCPTGLDQIDMQILDNTREQNHKITITAQPAQQPNIAVRCARTMKCNTANDVAVEDCTSLSFGTVTFGDQPCDIVVELQNSRTAGKPTGPLHVDRMDVYVVNTEMLNTQIDGKDVGFSFFDLDGTTPLALPIEVPIPTGGMTGTKRFKMRFTGARDGTWFGQPMMGRGLRIYHDDPSPTKRPVVGVTVTGIGAAPAITVLPGAIDFGPVEQNTTRTATIVIGNAGSGALRLTDIRFATDTTMAKFRRTTDMGEPTITIPANTISGVKVFVSYTPRTPGQDSDELLIGSNDGIKPVVHVPLSGGATPRIRVDPQDTLVYELSNPPSPVARCKNVLVTNVGYGDLVVQRLDIVGPDNDRTHPSVDDFSITGCASLPCTNTFTLCPPSNPACTQSSKEIEICYDNNDNSSQDLVELIIDSTDPRNPSYKVVLSAEDRPCLEPTPVIMLDTMNPKVGMPVCANCTSSSPGGETGGGATIDECSWSFAFATSNPTPMLGPNPGNQTCFTPTLAGLHILQLNTRNSCQASASTPASETILIRAQ